MSKKHERDMNERRVSLFFDDETKALLNDLSQELGVPKSQIAAFFLLAGAANISQARSVLPRYLVPSRSPVWQYTIDLDRFRKDLDL